MPSKLRTAVKFAAIGLLGAAALLVAFVLLARSGYEWWATLIELVDTRQEYYAAATLEDLDVHRKAAAALAEGQSPEIDGVFAKRSQDRIAPGDGVVLALRKHIDRPLTIFPIFPDFEYTTIFIPDFVPSQRSFELGAAAGDSKIMAIYAAGIGYDIRVTCISYARAGTVSVEPLQDDRIEVRGRVQFMPSRLATHKLLPCGPTEVDIGGVYEKAEPGGRPLPDAGG